MYTRVVREGGYKGPIKAWDVVDAQEYPVMEANDTYLISGSVKDAYSDVPWILKLLEWTKQALAQDRPLMGVCFGHQIIARALGAKVGPTDNWEIGRVPLIYTADGETILKKYLGETPAILQSHRDQVFNTPPGAKLLASTEKGPVQCFYSPRKYLCVQGHPEFTNQVVHVIMTTYARGNEQDLATLAGSHNGLDFG